MSEERKSADPIHGYILKADSQDLKEIMDAAGLDPKTEAAWVKKIIDKNLAAHVPGDITALVDMHEDATENYRIASYPTTDQEDAEVKDTYMHTRQAILDAFSALSRDRDALLQQEKDLEAECEELETAGGEIQNKLEVVEGERDRLREAHSHGCLSCGYVGADPAPTHPKGVDDGK
jgi:hypothetical protein